MKNNENIKNILDDRIDNHEFDIPENLMVDLEERLDDFNEEPNNKKGFFFLLIVGLLLFVGIIGALFINKNDSNLQAKLENEYSEKSSPNTNNLKNKSNKKLSKNNIKPNKNELINEPNIEDSLTSKNKIQIQNNKQKNTLKTDDSLKQTTAKSKAKNKPQKKNNKHKKTKEQKTFLNNKAPNPLKVNQEKEFKTNSKNENKQIYKTDIKAKFNNNTNETTDTSLKQNDDILKQEVNLLVKNSFQEKQNDEFTSQKNESSKQTNNLLDENIDKTIEIDIPNKKGNPSSSQVENNVVLDSLNSEMIAESIFENKIDENDSTIQLKPKGKTGFSIALNTGPSFMFRDYTYNDKSILDWNFQLEINKVFFSKLTLGTGVSLNNYGATNIIEQIETVKHEYRKHDDITYHRIDKISSWDTISYFSLDTFTVKSDSLYTDLVKTNFNYLEIPINVGYKVLDTKKFDINITTGVSFGFLLSNSNSFIEGKKMLSLSKNQNIVINYLLSSNFMYEIQKNIHLTLTPKFKYNLNNLGSTNTKRNFSSFGINGGVLIDF